MADKPNAVVLDFFAGSGTTMHAVSLLNAEDGGHRRCVLVTNNEISEEDEKRFATEQYGNNNAVTWSKHPSEKGAKFSINYESEEFIKFKDFYGIAKYVTWPRITNSIMGVDEQGELLKGNYLTNIVEQQIVPRNVIQINYIDNPEALTKAQKKKIVATLCNKKLAQNVVGDNCRFAFSKDSKYTATVLFDDSAVEEWFSEIEVNDSIDTFYVITKNAKLFRSIKNKISADFEPIYTKNQVVKKMSDGLQENVKFFKCDWTPRNPEDYLLSNALCLHIREMIELQNGIEIDNKQNVLILNRNDFKNIILDPDKYKDVERIWLNQNIIFTAEEMKPLKAKGFKYIPKDFFGQELREAAE